MYVLKWQTVSALMRGLFWCSFPELRSNNRNKHQNNTCVSAETVRLLSTYIILFLIWHNKSINDDKNDNLYKSSPCFTHSVFVLLTRSRSIADDVKWPDNCEAITLIVIFNSILLMVRFTAGRVRRNILSYLLYHTHFNVAHAHSFRV